MKKLFKKTITFSVLNLVLALVLVTAVAGFYNFVYMSDYVPSLDCMTINRGYLKNVAEKYRENPDFENKIWPAAIEKGGAMNTICSQDLEKSFPIETRK